MKPWRWAWEGESHELSRQSFIPELLAAQDEETGEVILHGCRYDCENDSYFEYNPAFMHEWRLQPGTAGRGVSEQVLDNKPVEYPKINNAYTVDKAARPIAQRLTARVAYHCPAQPRWGSGAA